MPESEKPTKTEDEKWITVNGNAMRVDPDAEAEDKSRPKMPSVRGEKEKNTKAALSKIFIKRYDLIPSIFNTRDEVVFDEYKKSGVVAGIDGDYLKILTDGHMDMVKKTTVFKKIDLIDKTHWDTASQEYRIYLLEKSGLHMENHKRNWIGMLPNIRSIIQKANTPAGYESTSSGIGNPIYNPLNTDKTVSQRLKEEEAKQKEQKDESTD